MSKYTPMDDDDTQYGDLMSVESFSAIATNINYLIDSVKPGKIYMVAVGIPGVPDPDPRFWQECDGSMITDENSPLRGHETPDYSDVGRYMRGYATIGEVGNYAGSHTKNLAHSHGGATGGTSTEGTDNDDDMWNTRSHTHTISSDLNSPINFEPAHVRIKHFIKIR